MLSAKKVNGPVLVQVNTVKGYGYEPAMRDPGEYHGVSSFDIETGKKPETNESYAEHFGKTLAELARNDQKICAITAAMKYGSGLNFFNGDLKERLFDVGIAEEHAVSFAAGLAKEGMLPVFSVYSSFLQRCYDELMHDVSIAGLHVVIAVGNAGLVGEDGETHQGLYDISFMSTIPGVTIYSPSSFEELDLCLNKALYEDNGLVCVRFPRGNAQCQALEPTCNYQLYKRNSDTLLVSYGREVDEVYKATEKLQADCLKLVKVIPLDDEIIDIIKQYKKVFIFEDAAKNGSIGEKLKAYKDNLHIYSIDGFVPSMKICEAKELYKLSSDKISEEVRKHI